ncbi:MAG: hypothetical protein HQK59_01725 [Deltaproteobacteria bacterium]|nr:hypothetical protein [Deltaproteobacteria bacterium]
MPPQSNEAMKPCRHCGKPFRSSWHRRDNCSEECSKANNIEQTKKRYHAKKKQNFKTAVRADANRMLDNCCKLISAGRLQEAFDSFNQAADIVAAVLAHTGIYVPGLTDDIDDHSDEEQGQPLWQCFDKRNNKTITIF